VLAMVQITMGEATEKASERTLRDAAKPVKSRKAKAAKAKRGKRRDR
jgi:hypothetical protein